MKRASLLLVAILFAMHSYAQNDKSGADDHLIKKNLLVDGTFSSAGGKDLILQTNQTTRITVLNTSGYIGMGITNPKEMLHINGSIRGNSTGGALRVNTQYGWFDLGPQDGQSAHLSTGMSRFLLNKSLWVDGSISSFGNRNLELQTNGNTRITVLDNNGYVGIGVVSPSEALEVEGNIKATQALISKELITESFQATDGEFSNNLKVGNNVIIDGLVGIGVEQPSEKLEIAGNLKVSETITTTDLQSQSGSFGEDLNVEGNTSVGGHTVINGNLGIGVDSPEERLEVAGNAVISNKITTSEIESNAVNVSDALTVENKIILNGQMGVGVEAPTEALEIAGNVKASDKLIATELEVQTGTFSDRVTVVNDVNIGSKLGIGVENPIEALELAGNAVVSQELRAASVSTESMAVNGDFEVNGNSSVAQNSIVLGQMGVGVESPTEKLDVAGNIKASEGLISNTLDTENATIAQDVVVNRNALIDGNLGVGVDNPSEKLEVAGNATISETLTAKNLNTKSMTVDGDFAVNGNSTVAQNSIISGQLGVGVDNPSERIDVAGNIKVSDALLSNSLETANATITDGIVITNNANVGGNLGLGVASPSERLEVSGNAVVSETLTAKNLNTESMTVDGDFAVTGNSAVAQNSIVSGQLGVGVDAPTEKIDVAGNIKASDALLSNSLETGNATITDGIVITNNANVGGNLGLGVDTPSEKLEVAGNVVVSETITAKNLNTESMTVDGDFAVTGNSAVAQNSIVSGQLGVGVNAPTEKIDVAGNIKASDALLSNSLETVNATIADGIVITNDANIGGNLGLGVESPSEKLEVAGNVVVSETITAKNLNTESMTVDGDFAVTGNSTVAQNSIVSGQLGVGVDTPTEKLDVAGNIKASEGLISSTLETSTATITDGIVITNNANIGGNLGLGVESPSEKLEVAGNAVISQTLTAKALSTESMSVSGDFEVTGSTNIMQNSIISGLVGVGVLAPTEKLEVAGNIKTTQSIMANSAQITNHLSASSINVSGNVGIGVSSPSRKLEVAGSIVAVEYLTPDGEPLKTSPWTESGNNLIFSSGNIGLGVDAPTRKLEVNGAIVAIDYLTPDGKPLKTSPWTESSSDLTYEVGNVGIGITSPSEKLEVNGNAKVTGVFSSSSLEIGGLEISNSNNALTTTKANISEMLVVGEGEAVTGDYLMAVYGNVVARGVSIRSPNDWPDYVFSLDYKLKPMTELRSYIQLNGHLPGLPSAKEMQEKESYDVGDMDKKLLEKIEELTLYLLEQQEEIQTLKKELESIKNAQ